jgi:uncharacterized damage-inducible protein DinB
MELQQLQYPIGLFEPQPFSTEQLNEWLLDIKYLPDSIEMAVQNLDAAQLQTPYRPGGWTVHQLVHHVADSHMNAYTRFKLGYTEATPTIKPYDENAWSQLHDVTTIPINVSLTLLHCVHQRLYAFLQHLTVNDWLEKQVYHPEQQKHITLWNLLGSYAWHGRHHTAHVNALKERMGW